MRARPPTGTISVERMRNIVVFPLPFGPSRPNNSAGRTSNVTPFKAVRLPYRCTSSRTAMADELASWSCGIDPSVSTADMSDDKVYFTTSGRFAGLKLGCDAFAFDRHRFILQCCWHMPPHLQ